MKTPTYSGIAFAPATRTGGYLPIEDFGLISSGVNLARLAPRR